jgi:hypothetical protein
MFMANARQDRQALRQLATPRKLKPAAGLPLCWGTKATLREIALTAPDSDFPTFRGDRPYQKYDSNSTLKGPKWQSES